MSGTIRDRLKTRTQRVGEVYSLAALKAGQANGQLVSFGCVITKGGTSNRQVLVSAGEIVHAGVSYATAAVTATSLPSGATTGAGAFRKVLLELSTAGALSFVVGTAAASQETAALPALTAAKVAIGYVELPESFTVDTTSLTDGMIVQASAANSLVAYHAA